jgi:hypothetical protein
MHLLIHEYDLFTSSYLLGKFTKSRGVEFDNQLAHLIFTTAHSSLLVNLALTVFDCCVKYTSLVSTEVSSENAVIYNRYPFFIQLYIIDYNFNTRR